MLSFDRGVIGARLVEVGRSQNTAFACSCVEFLVPLYEWYSAATARGNPVLIRRSLDMVWDVSLGGDAGELEVDVAELESLIPDAEGDSAFAAAFAEDAVLALLDAADTWTDNDYEHAVNAAVQLHSAADYVAQQGLPDFADLNSSSNAKRLAGAPIVQDALAGIASTLAGIGNIDGGSSLRALRSASRDAGQAWSQSVVQDLHRRGIDGP